MDPFLCGFHLRFVLYQKVGQLEDLCGSHIISLTLVLVKGFLYCSDRKVFPGLGKGNSMGHHAGT